MLNKTQKQFVVEHLRGDGFITRNECIKNFISRLGAIICDLKKEGWVFEKPHYFRTDNGQDFIYRVEDKPQREKEMDGHWEQTTNGMRYIINKTKIC